MIGTNASNIELVNVSDQKLSTAAEVWNKCWIGSYEERGGQTGNKLFVFFEVISTSTFFHFALQLAF